MKMKPEHLEALRAMLAPIDTPARRALYLNGTATRVCAATDLQKLYRWDCLWAADAGRWVIDTLYPYMHDGHIDTALRALVPPLTPEPTATATA